jgi:hypothetical protein
MPLFDDNGSGGNSYNGVGNGDTVICTTCHDPHGAYAAYAGNKGRRFRVNNGIYNYPGGDLCAACHAQ